MARDPTPAAGRAKEPDSGHDDEVRALHAVAVAEVLLGVALLRAPAAGDVPAVLLVAGAATAVLAVLLRRRGHGPGGSRVRELEPV
jgi:hypothetical protein